MTSNFTLSTFLLTLTSAALAQQHSTIPVVLVDGYNIQGCGVTRRVTDNFGNLAAMLQRDGASPTFYFDYCTMPAASIDRIGANFGQWLDGILGTGRPQVDVIAYSMGGLIVRSYFAGLNLDNNTLSPPLLTGIRRMVLIGSPNFGTSFWPTSLGGNLTQQQSLGSSLIGALATWNQGIDDQRGVPTVAIAGNGGFGSASGSDGVVSIPSASILWGYTRVIGPYCHTNSQLADFLTTCRGFGSIADVKDASHPTYQIIRSFFDGTKAWSTVGLDPSQATQNGGVLWQLLSNTGAQLPVNGTPTITSSVTSRWFVSDPFSNFWSTDSISGSPATIGFDYAGKDYAFDISPRPGAFWNGYYKFGPRIYNILSSAAPPTGAWSLAPDSLISIYGAALSSSIASAPYPWPLHIGDTTVTIDGSAPCPLNYASDSQINALLPSTLVAGLDSLTLQTSTGRHTLNVMIAPIVPFLFTRSGVVAALHSNYQIVTPANPASAGETISLFATGFGAYTQRGNLQQLNTTPQVLIDNLPATVTFAGRAPGYSGLDQINVQVPTGVQHGGNITVYGFSGGRYTNGAYLPIN
jgi:uncharacterized protein (TIGR03437 family)